MKVNLCCWGKVSVDWCWQLIGWPLLQDHQVTCLQSKVKPTSLLVHTHLLFFCFFLNNDMTYNMIKEVMMNYSQIIHKIWKMCAKVFHQFLNLTECKINPVCMNPLPLHGLHVHYYGYRPFVSHYPINNGKTCRKTSKRRYQRPDHWAGSQTKIICWFIVWDRLLREQPSVTKNKNRKLTMKWMQRRKKKRGWLHVVSLWLSEVQEGIGKPTLTHTKKG